MRKINFFIQKDNIKILNATEQKALKGGIGHGYGIGNGIIQGNGKCPPPHDN